jgi:RNA polymerase sigma-70 factor, ECF subfamily
MSGLDSVFQEQRPFLWSLAYRLTGCAADADDVVQEVFVRALERPPADTTRAWRPWLVRVLLNLGRDLLRRRRRRGYVGPWLPSPIATGEGDEPPSFDPPDLRPGPGARYDLLESVSLAFLLALEALTPSQRAVLLLRDVLDYSVRETASALDMSEANVKTTHLRARRAMAAYDRVRPSLAAGQRQQTGSTLQRFLLALGTGDTAAVEALLAKDARVTTDGGGEFVTARRIVIGRDKVARFALGLAAKAGALPQVELRTLNGLPAVILTGALGTGWAPRVVLQVALDDEGRIRDVWSITATRKLTAVREDASR